MSEDNLFYLLNHHTCPRFARENGIQQLDPNRTTTLALHLRSRLEQAGIPRGPLDEMVETLIAERNLLRQELKAAQNQLICLTRK